LPAKLIIAIDGPAGSGKGTASRRVAELLGYLYVDTGAMYRAVALKALSEAVPLDAPERLVALAEATRIDLGTNAGRHWVRLDGAEVTAEIRSPEVSQAASKVALIPGVRRVLVAEQRRAGRQGGVVMEGRDIGTVVFPDADLKIYLTASVEVRAERRLRDHRRRGEDITLEQMIEEVRERDRRDSQRADSPMVPARDAVLVDNSAMDIEETARLIVLLARERESAGAAPRANSTSP
jgi:cytidylate kinase